MKFDDILRCIGEFGPYQKRVYFLAAIPSILVAFETLSVIFIFNFPPHRCSIPGYAGDSYWVTDLNHSLLLNRSVPQTDGVYDECYVYTDVYHDVSVTSDGHNVTGDSRGLGRQDTHGKARYASQANRSVTKCNRWVFDHSVFESTIATDFGVVCGRSIERAYSNMLSEVGALFGVFACGFLADRFGRKIPFYIGAVALIAGGFGIAFTDNMLTLNICRFVLGIARMAVFINGFICGMEIVGPSKRVFTGLVIELVWCVGELLLLAFAYVVRQWRYLEIALSVPSIGLLVYWWIFPESPRWLVSKGRGKEAIKTLEKIAESNNTKMPVVGDTEELFEEDTKLSLRHVLTSCELLKRLLIVYSNMTVVAMVYYGLSLNVTNLGGDIFINYLIMVIVEAIGYLIPLFLLDRLGRKPVYCTSVLVAGICCVLSVAPVLTGAPEWVVVVMSMLGRLFVCIAFCVIYLYGAEVFPTVIRASTIGSSVTVSRLGSLAAPYLADIGVLVGGSLKDALPLIVMGSPALVVGLLSLYLPETKGVKLPETLEDLNKSKRSCGCGTAEEPDVREITVNGEAEALTTTPC